MGSFSTAGLLTFGNERAIPAEGGIFAGGGVTAKQGLRLVWEEALGAVHWWLLHGPTAGPAYAAGTTIAAAAIAAGRLRRLVDGTEALAYIHWGHQLVYVKL